MKTLKDLMIEVDGEKIALGDLIKTASKNELQEMGLVDDEGMIKADKLPLAAKNDEAVKEEKIEEAANFIKTIVFSEEKKASLEKQGLFKAVNTQVGSMGSTVPTALADEILTKKAQVAVLRGRAFSFEFTGKFQLPKEAVSVTAYWVEENAEVTESNPTTGSVVLDDHYLAARVLAPWKLLETSAYAVTNYFSTIAAYRLAEAEEKAFIAGSGTGQPKGIRSATITSVGTQAGATFSYNDLLTLYFGLPIQYRRNAVIITSTNGVKLTAGLTDTNGRPIFIPGQPLEQVFGKQILETNNIPENLGGGTETEMYIGDPFYYWIKDGQSLEMKSAEVLKNMQTEILVYQSVDGCVVLEEAFRKMTGIK